jgi:TPP-dependent pyruvate/acetoin dehydrogenase alpha subunit
MGDAQIYRDKDELKRLRRTRDPITLLREHLELSDEDWQPLDTEAQRVVEASVEFAKAGTDPRPEDALQNISAQ